MARPATSERAGCGRQHGTVSGVCGGAYLKEDLVVVPPAVIVVPVGTRLTGSLLVGGELEALGTWVVFFVLSVRLAHAAIGWRGEGSMGVHRTSGREALLRRVVRLDLLLRHRADGGVGCEGGLCVRGSGFARN